MPLTASEFLKGEQKMGKGPKLMDKINTIVHASNLCVQNMISRLIDITSKKDGGK